MSEHFLDIFFPHFNGDEKKVVYISGFSLSLDLIEFSSKHARGGGDGGILYVRTGSLTKGQELCGVVYMMMRMRVTQPLQWLEYSHPRAAT